MFFTFFKLCKLYHIAQRISYMIHSFPCNLETHELFHEGGCYHIETSPLICRELIWKELIWNKNINKDSWATLINPFTSLCPYPEQKLVTFFSSPSQCLKINYKSSVKHRAWEVVQWFSLFKSIPWYQVRINFKFCLRYVKVWVGENFE